MNGKVSTTITSKPLKYNAAGDQFTQMLTGNVWVKTITVTNSITGGVVLKTRISTGSSFTTARSNNSPVAVNMFFNTLNAAGIHTGASSANVFNCEYVQL